MSWITEEMKSLQDMYITMNNSMQPAYQSKPAFSHIPPETTLQVIRHLFLPTVLISGLQTR